MAQRTFLARHIKRAELAATMQRLLRHKAPAVTVSERDYGSLLAVAAQRGRRRTAVGLFAYQGKRPQAREVLMRRLVSQIVQNLTTPKRARPERFRRP